MADSLVLKGEKDVTKHTGTEMLLTRPKRGGDTHLVKEWWKGGGVSTCYVNCTIFNVTAGGDTVKLALDTNKSTDIRIDHDGSFGFNFFGINEVRRAALFTEDMQLIEHYVFPAISGGKVMTVTLAGAPNKPDGTPGQLIGTVTVTGEEAPADSATESYTVDIFGDADDAVIVLTSSEAGDSVSGLDVTFDGAGARTLTATVNSVKATDSPATGTLVVTVS